MTAQIIEVRVYFEIRKARETFIRSRLEPFYRFVLSIERRVRGCDVVGSVVEMTEAFSHFRRASDCFVRVFFPSLLRKDQRLYTRQTAALVGRVFIKMMVSYRLSIIQPTDLYIVLRSAPLDQEWAD